MQSCGVKVAMDDFGSGHTSFRNLRSLRVDLLKIDGAFIQNLARSKDDRFFVRTLIDLARHLEIQTVAEWVEDAASASILTEWGVDYLQGNYFGEPQSAAAAPRAAAIGSRS
jgi:EAL domain-containing protein (putative c-di-GMP-specific phosphodiesterase class I)